MDKTWWDPVLHDAPSLTEAQRVQLEADYKALINDMYGGEDVAADALLASQDGLVEEYQGAGGATLLWPHAELSALARLGPRVPPGAQFVAELNYRTLRGE